jgi:hypothetical protein
MGVDDRPCVIDFRVDAEEMCFPMVPAGASNDDLILGPRGATPVMKERMEPVVRAEVGA